MRPIRIDDLTAAAIKRMRSDPDFSRVVDWLDRELNEQDQANRVMTDGVLLRMGQGAATTLAVVVAHFKGKPAAKGVLDDTRVFAGRRAQSDTSGGAS